MNWFYISALVAICSVAVSLPILGGLDNSKYKCKTLDDNVPKLSIDFERYIGKWYELYHTDMFNYDHTCICNNIKYERISDNLVSIDNSCYRNGELVEKIGKGKIINNTSLEVSYGLSLYSQYDVVYIDTDYNYAAVLSCSSVPIIGGINLWILGRSYESQIEIQTILDYLKSIGLKNVIDNLVKTNHNNCPSEKIIEPSLIRNQFILDKIYNKEYHIISQTHYTECNCINMKFHHNNSITIGCHMNNSISNFMSIGENYQILSSTLDYNNILVIENTTDFHDIYILSKDKSISHKIYMEFEYIIEELGYNYILQILDTNC
jgi:apolipoprotein D and lipocalin family protein